MARSDHLDRLRRGPFAFDGERNFLMAFFHQLPHGLLLPVRATHHDKRRNLAARQLRIGPKVPHSGNDVLDVIVRKLAGQCHFQPLLFADNLAHAPDVTRYKRRFQFDTYRLDLVQML